VLRLFAQQCELVGRLQQRGQRVADQILCGLVTGVDQQMQECSTSSGVSVGSLRWTSINQLIMSSRGFLTRSSYRPRR